MPASRTTAATPERSTAASPRRAGARPKADPAAGARRGPRAPTGKAAQRAGAAEADALAAYRAKRDFSRTPEPTATALPARAPDAKAQPLRFVIQKHDASRLHYDLRLELDGVLLSWAVPKGPSLDPADKRLAVRTEDHPLAYLDFEGRIPEGEYGAGEMIVWDCGHWLPLADPHEGLARGKLAFELDGQKLQGAWELILPSGSRAQGSRPDAWLLFKKRDAEARPRSELDITLAAPDRVARPAAARTPARGTPAPAVKAAPGPQTPPPDTLEPQLAVLADALPARGRWIFETKFDGYRLLARLQDGRVRLFTRNGKDWTERLPELVAALGTLGPQGAWLDGEIVVDAAGGAGPSDFHALQNAFDGARSADVRYCLFDVPWFDGHDLRGQPVAARRDLLRAWIAAHPHPLLRFSEALAVGGAADATRLLQAACRAQEEGIMAKREDAPYRAGRDERWVKLKCAQRQEFVVAGYTLRADDDSAVGSLVLGTHDAGGALVAAGSVGTGWSREDAVRLLRTLAPLATDTSPLAAPSAAKGGTGPRRPPGRPRSADREAVQWLRPERVAEVRFGAWTPAGAIRHASFVALREDKPAAAVQRERPRPGSKPAAPSAPPSRLTHPERVIDASTGATKLDLFRYYESMADALLPFLKDRPVALLRGPGGVDAPLFFQKHAGAAPIPGLVELPQALWPEHEALLGVRTVAGVLGAAQMNVLEFHPWNTRTRHMATPDRMVFDLDPGEGVAWPAIRDGARLVRAMLDELGLPSWIKTSGGKGLHVVVPLAPQHGFDTVKAFSKAIVTHLAATLPALFVAVSGPSRRIGRIFVDYLRNGEGATTVAAFSVRARPGLGVSMPIAWEDLDDMKGASPWNLRNARDHLSLRAADPWADFTRARTALARPMKRLGWTPPA